MRNSTEKTKSTEKISPAHGEKPTVIQQELNRKVYVLAVDDQSKNLISLEQLLNNVDLEVVTAQSGAEALKTILNHDFCCILLDIRMPDMDGFEVANIIRSDRQFANIPIIFVTAEARDQDAIFQGYESGAVDFLIKPLSPSILKAKIKVFADLYRQKKALDKSQLIEDLYAQLKESNDQLKEYTHIASHDLREPGRRILCLVDLLLAELEEKPESSIAEICLDIRNCTSELIKLVDSFRDLTVILDSPQQFSEVNLDEKIRMVVAERTAEIQDRAIEIVIDNQPTLSCNDYFIAELLRSLLDNALVHTGTQSILIRFCAEKVEGRWQLGVFNTGSTIASSEKENIFKPFARLSSNQKWQHPGLGLTKVRKIVEHHQGSILVESTADSVCFTYTLGWRIHD